jgi:CRISPR-associated protein Cmr5
MAETRPQEKPTLDQRRARHAWEAVTRLKQMKPEDAKEYAREAKKLPTRIVAAGLGQALAFILAKAKDKKPNLKQLHDDLTDWVLTQRQMAATRAGSLLQSIIHGSSDFLRRATDETLAYLLWLNRFAEAEGLTEGEA